MESSDLQFKNMTSKDLKVAAKMFIYLNACPGLLISSMPVSPMENWFRVWHSFYIDLLKDKPLDRIILTLNRMMKKSTKGSYDFLMNQKLFARMATLLKFKYNEIQSLLPARATNISMTGNQEEIKNSFINASGVFFMALQSRNCYKST